MSAKSKTERGKNNDAPLWIGGGLFIAVLAVFGQTLRHGFLLYDDGDYITANAMVLRGVTPEGLRWALTAIVGNLWHPLTMVSHMMDVQLFGLRPGLHHFVNVLLHGANAVLAFAALRRLTGDLWKSAMVAALFALHPLRAESVAWAAERKDVLSALFFFLGLLAYARYSQKRRPLDYLLVMLSYALGLCAKPMVVTFPFVLLLLDFWPLGRVQLPGRTEGRQRMLSLVVEKLPLFALTVGAAAIAIWSQSSTGATGSLEQFPLRARIANAIASYAVYLRQTFWPVDLAVMYPHPGRDVPAAAVMAGAAVLLLATMAALFLWDRVPYVLTGWLWFVGMLVPVIGLVQVGNTAHADRYTYLPQIGVLIAVVWGFADLATRLRMSNRLASFAFAAAVLALSALCYRQVSFWRDQVTLFEHTVAVSPGSAQAQFNLGAGYAMSGRPDLAEPHLRKSLRLNPQGAGAKANLAAALIELGRPKEAESLLHELIELDEYQPEYYVLLGMALKHQEQPGEALFWAGEALRIDPTYERALKLMEEIRKKGPPPEVWAE